MKLSELIVAVMLFGFVQTTYAQQPVFYGAQFETIEEAIEVHSAALVVAYDNNVIEIRVSECENCLPTVYVPAEAIEFFVGDAKVEALTAQKLSTKHNALVFIDAASGEVNSVRYSTEPVGSNL
jgi:hypothetical protein